MKKQFSHLYNISKFEEILKYFDIFLYVNSRSPQNELDQLLDGKIFVFYEWDKLLQNISKNDKINTKCTYLPEIPVFFFSKMK